MRAFRNPHFAVLLLCLTLSLALHAEETTKTDHALWEVGNDDTAVCLFGNLHPMRPEVNWLQGDVRAALDDADELILKTVEAEPAEAQRILMDVAVNMSGT